jgi:hypothetical protein
VVGMQTRMLLLEYRRKPRHAFVAPPFPTAQEQARPGNTFTQNLLAACNGNRGYGINTISVPDLPPAALAGALAEGLGGGALSGSSIESWWGILDHTATKTYDYVGMGMYEMRSSVGYGLHPSTDRTFRNSEMGVPSGQEEVRARTETFLPMAAPWTCTHCMVVQHGCGACSVTLRKCRNAACGQKPDASQGEFEVPVNTSRYSANEKAQYPCNAGLLSPCTCCNGHRLELQSLYCRGGRMPFLEDLMAMDSVLGREELRPSVWSDSGVAQPNPKFRSDLLAESKARAKAHAERKLHFRRAGEDSAGFPQECKRSALAGRVRTEDARCVRIAQRYIRATL